MTGSLIAVGLIQIRFFLPAHFVAPLQCCVCTPSTLDAIGLQSDSLDSYYLYGNSKAVV